MEQEIKKPPLENNVTHKVVEEKLEELTKIIFSILKALSGNNEFAAALSQKDMEEATIHLL